MGRITSENQYTLANATNGYPLQYRYDLAGDLVWSTDGVSPSSTPGTPLAFTSVYNGAGRLQTLSSNWFVGSSGSSQALFTTTPSQTTPSYAAFGGLANASFSGNAAISLNRTYDNRLRLTYEKDAGSVVGSSTAGSAVVTITGLEQSK
jgi:hypothetical protein